MGKLYTVIPKRELRNIWRDSLTKPPFGGNPNRRFGRKKLPQNIPDLYHRIAQLLSPIVFV